MMEFAMSRLALIVCGTILIGAVGIPLADIYSGEGDKAVDSMAENDARALDAIWNEDLDAMTIVGSRFLPTQDSILVLDGYFLTITDGSGGSHIASMKHPCDRMVIGFHDSVMVCRDGNRLSVYGTIIEEEPTKETDPISQILDCWDTGCPDDPYTQTYQIDDDMATVDSSGMTLDIPTGTITIRCS